MNPHRLVAAVAALAIGFGVTLVGVGLADDETVADSSALDEDIGGFEGAEDDIEDGAVAPAEQQAEVAQEADPAEIEPAASAPGEQVETDQGPTSSTCDDLAESGASDGELLAEGCDPAAPDNTPSGPQATCRAIYELTLRDGEQSFVVVRRVQNGGVSIEPDGEFVQEGERDVERLDDLGLFFVDPNGDPILERPCDNVGEVVDLEGLSEDAVDGGSTTRAGSGDRFPCELPVGRVLDDLEVGGFIDLDQDGEESDWESYVTLLDAALVRSTGDASFEWGVQVAAMADSAMFQELDCGIAARFWEELIEAPSDGERVDPTRAVCFLVQFVELVQRSDGSVANPFIDYLDDASPATAGCPIFESMVL